MEPVTVSVFVPADREAVRRAFLDAGELARWWWPQWPDVNYRIDPRPGGSYRIHCDANGLGVHGEILTLGDGAAVITWIWEDGPTEGPTETVTIQFTDVDGPQGEPGTDVTVTHICGDPEPLRQGWTDVLARLATLSFDAER